MHLDTCMHSIYYTYTYMAISKPMPKKRIAFGPEIYIIHWDYLTLEYDDVTIVNERLSDWATERLSVSLLNSVHILILYSILRYLFVLHTNAIDTDLCTKHRAHILFCAVWFVQSSYIVEHSVDICMCHRHIVCSDFTYFTSDMLATSYLFIYFVNVHTIQMRYKGLLPNNNI